MTKQHLPNGSTAEGPWSLRGTPEQAGWAFCGRRVLELAPGAAHPFATGADALLVMPMEGGGVVEALGAWVEKSNYGRKYLGIDRSTFLVDGDGRIVRAWRGVKVPGHVEEVREAARTLTDGKAPA